MTDSSEVEVQSDAKERLRTKNVFIDTSVHIAGKFNYVRGRLRHVSELAESNMVRLFETSIEVSEIRSHILEQAQSADDAFSKFTKNSGGFAHSPSARPGLDEIKPGDIARHLNSEYEAYRKRSGAVRVDLGAPEEVFERYFGLRPPFGVGKKRSEFPDGFIVGALDTWCQKNGEEMYVVAVDEGLLEAAKETPTLIPIQGIERFLDLVVGSENPALAGRLTRLVSASQSELDAEIIDSFKNSGFYVEDAEGDVEEVDVKEIKTAEPLLVELTEQLATFAIPCEVTFEADVSYDDPDSWVVDHEDDRVFYLRHVNKRIIRSSEVLAEIHVPSDAKSLGDASVRVVINGGENLPVSIEDEIVEEYPSDDSYDSWAE